MKKLKTVFKATLVRYNFSKPFMNVSAEFDKYPTEDELMKFLNTCNEKQAEYKNFETTINVEKTFRVINMEKFFAWLRSIGKLDEYEAALDISLDFAGVEVERLKAGEVLDKLDEEFKSIE